MQNNTNNGSIPVRVAMDAMGGDHGPVATVTGAILAAKTTDADKIAKEQLEKQKLS